MQLTHHILSNLAPTDQPYVTSRKTANRRSSYLYSSKTAKAHKSLSNTAISLEPYILLAFQRLSRILTSISPFSTTISNTFIKNPTYWWHLRIFHAKPP